MKLGISRPGQRTREPVAAPPPSLATPIPVLLAVILGSLALLFTLVRRKGTVPASHAPPSHRVEVQTAVPTNRDVVAPLPAPAHQQETEKSASRVPDIEDCHRPGRVCHTTSPLLRPLGEPRPLYAAPIAQLHLELTSKCNAACPQCLRNVRGGRDNPRLPLTELSLADVQLAVSPLLPSLERVMLCGNYGDPSAARDCLRVVSWLRQAKPSLVVAFFSNGGAKAPTFWAELGRLLTAPSFCRFAIDGLEDTNHLYRQKVQWTKLEANVRAFVAAGGHAQQDFLVFRHNEHQLALAQAWAARMGIVRFQLKRTKRFVDKASGVLLSHTPVEDSAGQVVRKLEPPLNPKYRNEADMHELRAVLDQYGSLDEYYDQAAICCKAASDREIYLSAECLLFPCCFLAGELYNRRGDSQLLKLLTEHGVSLESLRVNERRSTTEVLQSPLFTHLTVASWAKPSLRQGKLRTCAAVCGTEHRSYARQWA